MKLYTTDEVIKELRKNQERKFRLNNKNEELGMYEGRLMWLYAMEDFEINKSTIEYKWEKIEEPVDFITAVKNGGKVKVLHKEIANKYCDINTKEYGFYDLDEILSILADIFTKKILADIILNGEWYIED